MYVTVETWYERKETIKLHVRYDPITETERGVLDELEAVFRQPIDVDYRIPVETDESGVVLLVEALGRAGIPDNKVPHLPAE
jgi:hypothetical protein